MLKTFGIPKIPSIILWLVTPAASFMLLESLSHSVQEDMEMPLILLNLLFYYLLYGLILVLSKRSCVSLSLGTLFVMLVGLVNYYVIQFRSVPLYPWDVLSAGTAASVSGNYDYSLDREAKRIVIAFVILLLIGLLTRWKLVIRNRQYHLAAVLGMLTLGTVYAAAVQMPEVHQAVGFYEYLFTPNAFYQQNGFMVSFLSNTKYISVARPGNYSTEAVARIFEPYVAKSEAMVGESGKKPNLIVIMNEAFSDPAILGDFETNVDYMPNIRALTENTIKGNLFVPVKGGNTANTEYEFLTGNSMAYLPIGSIPYQQYIRGDMPSIAGQLAGLGYETHALHPYRANGWNRKNVYSWFGFENSHFREAFAGAPVLREYTTDFAIYEKVIELYEAKEDGRPLFAFSVTMQNHSSYSKEYENFTPDVEVYGSEKDVLLERYLSLIKVSDEAFGKLVEYFSQADEPTIILMFGDHQPADWVVRPIYRMNGIKSTAEWSESAERYQTPYILWANYDIDEEGIKSAVSYDSEQFNKLSSNYLNMLLFEAAGLPMSPYQLFMKDLCKDFPILTVNMFIDGDGVFYAPDAVENQPQELKDYRILNYNHLFDPGHRNDTWYE